MSNDVVRVWDSNSSSGGYSLFFVQKIDSWRSVVDDERKEQIDKWESVAATRIWIYLHAFRQGGKTYGQRSQLVMHIQRITNLLRSSDK